MSTVTDTVKSHHREIASRLLASGVAASGMPSDADLEALLSFLNDDLLPHARGEEAHLYVAIDSLVPMPGRATATMRIDHEHIETYARTIGIAVQRIRSAMDDQGVYAGRAALRELVQRLQAIVDLHLEKEERVYLPLIERFLTEEAQQRLLEEIHETADASTKGEPVVDVRGLPHTERHGRIFETFDHIHDGESFVLVNDHDPKPLYYRFAAQLAGRFTWEYLERGPDWKVRIGRPAAATAVAVR